MLVMTKDPGLEALLDLHGQTFVEDGGYWYKIEAWRVAPSTERPHGIRYNLTFHNKWNQRLFGFDNAHAVAEKAGGRFSGRRVVHDHRHLSPQDKGTPYGFSSAQQLLTDFFDEVNRFMQEVGQ